MQENAKFFHFSNFSLLIFFSKFSPASLFSDRFSRDFNEFWKNSRKQSPQFRSSNETSESYPNAALLNVCVWRGRKASLGINAKENFSQWKCATIRAFSSFLAICHDNDLIHIVSNDTRCRASLLFCHCASFTFSAYIHTLCYLFHIPSTSYCMPCWMDILNGYIGS